MAHLTARHLAPVILSELVLFLNRMDRSLSVGIEVRSIATAMDPLLLITIILFECLEFLNRTLVSKFTALLETAMLSYLGPEDIIGVLLRQLNIIVLPFEGLRLTIELLRLVQAQPILNLFRLETTEVDMFLVRVIAPAMIPFLIAAMVITQLLGLGLVLKASLIPVALGRI